MRVKRVPLTEIHPDPANVRVHGPENLETISGSLRRFSQVEPLVVQAGTGRIIAGNGRYSAMKTLGWTECDVVEVELNDLQAAALSIACNRSASLGVWDEPALAKLLEELRSEDALEGVGYSSEEIDALLEEIGAELNPDLEDPGPEEPPATPISRVGDLWVMGEHRLLTGDSTRIEDVRRVMAGDCADLVSTDPPFVVDFTGERPNNSGKDWTATYREIDIKDAKGFFRSVFTSVIEVLAPHAAIYCWHAHKRCGVIQSVWEELGILDHQQVIWVKPTAVFGRVFWHFRHEPCMMGWRKGSAPKHDGDQSIDSVWEVNWEGKQRIVGNEHPMQKPVELYARPIRKHTKVGAIVFEPFSGSGSQIIAAEQLKRRCRAIEISPAFVDVAVVRWQKATGKSATLDGDGRPFEEIAKERAPA